MTQRVEFQKTDAELLTSGCWIVSAATVSWRFRIRRWETHRKKLRFGKKPDRSRMRKLDSGARRDRRHQC